MTESEYERNEDWAFWATEEAERIAQDQIDTGDLGELVVEHAEGALLGILLDAIRYEQGPEAEAAAYKDLMTGLKSSIEAVVYRNLEEQREQEKRQAQARRIRGRMADGLGGEAA